jgi:LuxR family maltose regulon positive regulatory protein
MNIPLLETKLIIPPLQDGLVPRPRLIQRLESGPVGRLALVCAPPGFGKTTLLSDWAHCAGLAVAWLSLDEGDNDPVRFLLYLIRALQKVDGELGKSALAHLLSPPSPAMPPPPSPAPGSPLNEIPAEAGLASLLNDVLAAGKPMALVLDDYHLIQAGAVHQAPLAS